MLSLPATADGYNAYSKPETLGMLHALIQLLEVGLVPMFVPPEVSLKLAGFLMQ